LLIGVGVLVGAAVNFAKADTTLVPAIAGLQAPVDIANAPDGSGRPFIVEQQGYLSERYGDDGVAKCAPQ
jgi:hypothetical protein